MATSTFDESLSIEIDSDAQQAIAKELGSLNKFYDRLAGHVASETDGAAKLVPAAQTLPGGDQSRGGGVEIVAAAAGLIQVLAPIIIAWIKSRGYEASLTERRDKKGNVTRTVHVRRGSGR